MKRIDAIRGLIKKDVAEISVELARNGGYSYSASELVRLYEYLDEELCDPKDEQQKPKEKLDACKADKPIPEKVVAGSKKQSQQKKVDEGKLIALYNAGRTGKWIADDMGVSPASVSMHLAKLRQEGKIK